MYNALLAPSIMILISSVVLHLISGTQKTKAQLRMNFIEKYSNLKNLAFLQFIEQFT